MADTTSDTLPSDDSTQDKSEIQRLLEHGFSQAPLEVVAASARDVLSELEDATVRSQLIQRIQNAPEGSLLSAIDDYIDGSDSDTTGNLITQAAAHVDHARVNRVLSQISPAEADKIRQKGGHNAKKLRKEMSAMRKTMVSMKKCILFSHKQVKLVAHQTNILESDIRQRLSRSAGAQPDQVYMETRDDYDIYYVYIPSTSKLPPSKKIQNLFDLRTQELVLVYHDRDASKLDLMNYN